MVFNETVVLRTGRTTVPILHSEEDVFLETVTDQSEGRGLRSPVSGRLPCPCSTLPHRTRPERVVSEGRRGPDHSEVLCPE